MRGCVVSAPLLAERSTRTTAVHFPSKKRRTDRVSFVLQDRSRPDLSLVHGSQSSWFFQLRQGDLSPKNAGSKQTQLFFSGSCDCGGDSSVFQQRKM